ncbi:MAG: EAL domain-containing protein [Gammaproteobacteria bacterium]|nr:EAL domain-containing protein [Gammaproteobacteria bacterium]MDH3535264.1 EAL domain-containing protein [Gammaproteobacteria bacterium]
MENEEKLIRLLIVDEGFHKAEQITSSLRATGMHVRAEFAEDSEDMCDILENKTIDLVLFSIDLPDFTLSQGQHLIRECGRHVALVAMAKKVNTEIVVNAINEGAQDVVASDSLEHLIQVIKREAYNINIWRRAMRLEMDFQESEKRCQNLLSNSKDAVAYVHEGMHIFANQVYMELFGNTDFDELEGTPIIDMVDASQQNQLKAFLRDLSKNENETNELELQLIHSSGERISAILEFSRASYDGEPCTQILIRSRADTTELEEQINYLHQHDLITGLYNRQHFMEELKNSITQAINGVQQSFLVYIAIDNFQSIRDMVGISGCDTLISDIAMIIKDNAAEDDLVSRFGAYSYTCLGKVTEKKLAEDYATRVIEAVEQHISEIGNQSISATCSASIVFLDENSPDNSNDIIARAERSCGEVEAAGGNSTRTYIPKAGEMTQEEEDGIIADLIKDALNHNRIRGMYQPIVGVKAQSGERYVSSVEITSGEGHVLYPKDYQAAAERTGTAKMLDRWKILHAIKKVAETSQQGRKIEIFLPLSADSIKDPGLAIWVSENLAKAKINGEQLIFMVDEASAVNQLKAAKTLAKGLQQIHCKFAIDEFGTGLNPFQLIKHVDADYVRINHVYMDGLAHNNENQDSIRELAYQAMDMEVNTITPGVTDAAVLSVLWTLNVDFVQGDFLQSPQKELNYDFSSM